MLLPVASVYLCESTFYKLTTSEKENLSRLHVELELRIALSGIRPGNNILAAGREAHPCLLKVKVHPITNLEGPRGGVEV
jgi:hypothetical protein